MLIFILAYSAKKPSTSEIVISMYDAEHATEP